MRSENQGTNTVQKKVTTLNCTLKREKDLRTGRKEGEGGVGSGINNPIEDELEILIRISVY